MEQLLDRREEWADQRRGHVAEMRKRATEAEAKLNRLYEAIENGLLSPDDASLKDRVAELSGVRDQARADAERISASVERLAPTITPDALARFATAARRKLPGAAANGSGRSAVSVGRRVIDVGIRARSRERKGKKTRTACANFAHVAPQPTDYTP